MSRVLLVNSNTVQDPYPVPPIGLCLVAESLTGHEVRVFDGAWGGGGLANAAASFRPDVVGLGIRNIDDMVMQRPQSYIAGLQRDFAAPLRALNVPFILGGSGLSLFPGPLLDALDGDFAVVGEGETVFPALLRALEEGGDPAAVPGVLARGREGPASPSPAVAEVPFSSIDRLLDYAPYEKGSAYPVQTKRGCAHRCIYCTYPRLEGRQYRPRNPADVAQEIAQTLARLGDVTFEFVDSTFNDPPGHAEAVCRAILDLRIRPRLRAMGINPLGASERLFQLMKEAGFRQIHFSPDAASDPVLAGLKKGFVRADLEKAARMLARAAIPAMWFFLLGGPGETRETVLETLDFALHHVGANDMVYLAAGIRIYPETPLHGLALRQRLVAQDDDLLAQRFYVSPHLDPEELRHMVEETAAAHPNVVPAWDTHPGPEVMAEAARRRAQASSWEPMFRTLIRIRAEKMQGSKE
jgi:radical SAM superfamily enzyme YgiQ (UPF0313 family)